MQNRRGGLAENPGDLSPQFDRETTGCRRLTKLRNILRLSP